GCADRPSFVSIKRVMEKLEKSESLAKVIEVQDMHKLKSYEESGDFVVEVYFEQHFLLGLVDAVALTEQVINEGTADGGHAFSNEAVSRSKFIETMLAEKHGRFKQGEFRRRYATLVFRKENDQWAFSKQRDHWKDFDMFYFPENKTLPQ
ncbi:MAG: hypothetical protein KUG83_01725, partial [Gammaproteobacteria bacterium]|nr:hypothetical protein [Gammaproteobacteria bacterium]